MADSCDTCGFKSSEIKGGGGVPERGRRMTLAVSEPEDLQVRLRGDPLLIEY